MRVLKKARFDEAGKHYPNEAKALDDIYRILKSTDFQTPDDLKKQFGSLDRFRYRKKWWIIDVGGNRLRILAMIDFGKQLLFVKHIVDHKNYDRLIAVYRSHPE